MGSQLNASNGHVTPLLFSNDASTGGGFGISLEAQTGLAAARRGGLYVDVTGALARDVPNNAVKYNCAAESIATTRQLKATNRGISADKQFFDLQRKAKEIQQMINSTPKATGRLTAQYSRDAPSEENLAADQR